MVCNFETNHPLHLKADQEMVHAGTWYLTGPVTVEEIGPDPCASILESYSYD